MDILKQLNAGVEDIERNLCGEADLDRAAKLVCMTKDSFLRFFSYMTGMTVVQYIRRRKLTLAVRDLQQDGARVLDVALKYGYDGADAFSRAFTRQHGVTPQAARRKGVPLKLYQPVSFALTVKGAQEMRFQTVELQETKVFEFLKKRGGGEDDEGPVAALWNHVGGDSDDLEHIRKTVWYGIWREGKNVLSRDNGTVWYGFWKEGRYTIVPTDGHGSETREFTLSAGQYAVFGMEPGGDAWEEVPHLREQILEGWLPGSGYTLRDSAAVEIHHQWTDWEQTRKVRYYEIWVPVEEKKSQTAPAEKPLISVLVPVYQAEEYLARCVDSVLAQTYPSLEVVLVDDGSADNSALVAARYRDKPNVRFYQEEHRGVSYVRQKLIERARGDYFFFLDSDDYIDSRTLEILFDLMAEYNADMVQCRQEQVWKHPGDRIDYDKGHLELYRKENLLTRFCCGSGPLRGMMAGKLCRRDVFRDVLFPIGKIHEGEYAIQHILANCEKVVCTDLPLYHYFYNPHSLTKKGFSYEKYDILGAAADRYHFCREQGLAFAADMVCFWYVWLAVEMYRNTWEKISRSDGNLNWLGEKCRCACEYLLTKDYFDDRTRAALAAWRDDPLQGEWPWYWTIAEKIYRERTKKE